MKILIMRPTNSGKKLVDDLKKINISSWNFSFFNFYPSLSSINLSNKINELYNSNIVVVFSKTCIYYTNLFLEDHNLTWPSYVKYFTIGKSTAIDLCKYVKKKSFFLKMKKIVKIY